MRPGDHFQAISPIKLFRNILSKSVPRASWRNTPTFQSKTKTYRIYHRGQTIINRTLDPREGPPDASLITLCGLKSQLMGKAHHVDKRT